MTDATMSLGDKMITTIVVGLMGGGIMVVKMMPFLSLTGPIKVGQLEIVKHHSLMVMTMPYINM